MTENLIRVVHLALHELPGITALPSAEEVEILPQNGSGARVFLTMDREPYNLHLRRLAALGIIHAGVFVGPGGNRTLAPYQERFADAFSRTRVTERTGQPAALMVTMVTSEIAEYKIDHLLDLGDFGARLQIFDNTELESAAEHATRVAFAGLTLSLGEHITDTMIPRGDIFFALEPETDRKLYSVTTRISVSSTSSTHLTTDDAEKAAELIDAISRDDSLTSIVRLLSISAKCDADQLTAFLSAWSGLELFVQGAFKKHFEPFAFKKFLSAAPESKQFVDRIQAVMKDKYNIRDKFGLVAGALGGSEIDADIETFETIKKKRDNLVHAMSSDLQQLPTIKVRRLLRKYLQLHLESEIGKSG